MKQIVPKWDPTCEFFC